MHSGTKFIIFAIFKNFELKKCPNLVKIYKTVQNSQKWDEIGQNVTATNRQTYRQTNTNIIKRNIKGRNVIIVSRSTNMFKNMMFGLFK